MDFVLTLHSHLPWVLHHGRWPHGSDWLCEAALDTYLPLLEVLERMELEGVASPLTVGVTPVLANQLAHPDLTAELDGFFAQRLTACDEATSDFEASGEVELLPLTQFWRSRLVRLHNLFRRLDGGMVGTLARHARAGRIELLSSAATHGFLPLQRRPESVQLQLRLGRQEHRRLFGLEASGCWLPECAYREGLEQPMRDAGFDFFFVDAHMAEAGHSLGLYGERDFVDGLREPEETALDQVYPRSPYRAYYLRPRRGEPVAVLVREQQTSLRVWSRHQGYPGDAGYLEFHKIRWPGGLKLWRVTGSEVDLGAKEPYDANVARARAYKHATDYVSLLHRLQSMAQPLGGDLIATPFDTELFGHWWFEGVDFLGDLYRGLAKQQQVRPVTASRHLKDEGAPGRQWIRLAEGSWGANGDFSKWQNPGTQWTWDRLGPLEERFWSQARRQLTATAPALLPVWTQATRELLLAQASDWQFIISTGAATDYAEKRFAGHCDALDDLLTALDQPDPGAALRLAREHAAADDCFDDPLQTVREVLDLRD
jgi:1,4-alpha-glucan branching enzyme